jgi:hypothetical protein
MVYEYFFYPLYVSYLPPCFSTRLWLQKNRFYLALIHCSQVFNLWFHECIRFLGTCSEETDFIVTVTDSLFCYNACVEIPPYRNSEFYQNINHTPSACLSRSSNSSGFNDDTKSSINSESHFFQCCHHQNQNLPLQRFLHSRSFLSMIFLLRYGFHFRCARTLYLSLLCDPFFYLSFYHLLDNHRQPQDWNQTSSAVILN